MRAAPAVNLRVTRFGVWRAAVAAVLAAVWLVVFAWVVSHARAQGGMPPDPVAAVAVVALVAASVLGLRLAAVPAFDLRWDGRSWHLAASNRSPSGATPADAVPGDLRAAIDLGSWLLLRFTPERTSAAPAVPRWLPLQRAGLEPSWHALRCAVHSPRPALAAPAAE